MDSFVNNKFSAIVPMRNAMNEITRAAYVEDCNVGIRRWNRLISKHGYDDSLSLPSTKFKRNIGLWANLPLIFQEN